MSAAINIAKHAISRTFSVICTLAVFIGIGWLIWVGMVKPHYKPLPTTRQEAQVINNIEIYNPEDKFFLGLRIFGLKIGISIPVVKKLAEITEITEEVKKSK
jgi:hypothetical protein